MRELLEPLMVTPNRRAGVDSGRRLAGVRRRTDRRVGVEGVENIQHHLELPRVVQLEVLADPQLVSKSQYENTVPERG